MPALAVPDLQLDVQGGSYVGGTDQTTYSAGSVFDLYALLDPSNNSPLGANYRISIAIVPSLDQSNPAPAFGSFSVNGTVYSVGLGNMIYGTPPVEAVTNPDELQSHGVFETYYGEYAFNFNSANEIGTYDVQTSAGDPESEIGNTGSYYNAFDIDATGLLAGYALHFDLYEVEVETSVTPIRVRGQIVGYNTTTTYGVGSFAPFSHDAQSGGEHEVPDAGTTLALLGAGMIGVGALRRRLAK